MNPFCVECSSSANGKLKRNPKTTAHEQPVNARLLPYFQPINDCINRELLVCVVDLHTALLDSIAFNINHNI